MNDENVASDVPAGEDVPSPKRSRKRLLIIVAGAILALGGTGGGALWFFGNPLSSESEADGEAEHEAAAPVFYELPEIVIRLEGGSGQYLKLGTVLDLTAEEDVESIKSVEPRLLDMLQTYLIELTPDDLRGAAGMYRVREDLLRRINEAVPNSTRDVLFKTIILQ